MSPADIAVLATVVGSIVLFGGAAVLAMGWAFRNGQFDNFQRGAVDLRPGRAGRRSRPTRSRASPSGRVSRAGASGPAGLASLETATAETR